MTHRILGLVIIVALSLRDYQTVKIGTKKYLVSVQHLTKGSNGFREHKCSGVLLTRRIVLTACSCVTKVQQDPITYKKSATLIDSKSLVVYVGSSMDTKTMQKTEDREVQKVEVMYKHPLCDAEFSFDFALIIVEQHFSIKGVTVVKRLHQSQTILEFVVGTLDIPRACSTFSWLRDDSTAPCVKMEFDKKHKFDLHEVEDDILGKMETLRGRKINRVPKIRRIKRNVNQTRENETTTNQTSHFLLAARNSIKNRIDVDFVDKKYCTSLISVCALNPHGCISGIHGLRCNEWCMRSLDCTERLCEIDTGSPVFCNKVLVGIVTRSQIINCEGNNRILAIVSGFEAALQFVRTSLETFKKDTARNLLQRASFASRQTSCFHFAVSFINIFIHQI